MDSFLKDKRLSVTFEMLSKIVLLILNMSFISSPQLKRKVYIIDHNKGVLIFHLLYYALTIILMFTITMIILHLYTLLRHIGKTQN